MSESSASSFSLSLSQVLWLQDGRRVLVTHSLDWFPSLWDGASLASLPLPEGFGQLLVRALPWLAADGRPLAAFSLRLRATPNTAPLLLHLRDPREPLPLVGTRSALIGAAAPLLPLLRLGYEIVQIECLFALIAPDVLCWPA